MPFSETIACECGALNPISQGLMRAARQSQRDAVPALPTLGEMQNVALSPVADDLIVLVRELGFGDRSMTGSNSAASAHDAAIAEQFTRQAAQFAASPAHHNQAALDLLVEGASPRCEEVSLDVACGPGTVVAAFARRVRRAEGLDATEAMLEEARKLAAREGLRNVAWHRGDVYALPFADGAFDIVSCRYAFHHLLEPARALTEMVRVCRDGGRVVLCDAFASDDPVKAAALNAMERYRDPSTVEFRTLGFLRGLFTNAGMPEPSEHLYGVPAELERLLAMAYPANDDRTGLRAMVEAAVEGDAMDVGARREDGTVRFEYPAAVLVAVK